MKSFLHSVLHAAWLPFAILIVASGAFVGVHAPQHAQISPYDEYVYLDYLAKVPTQGFLHSGDETGELARNELACRGVIGYGTFGDGCNIGNHSNDTKFPYNGGTGADIYAPPYFWITWALAQPFTWAGASLLEAGRLVGGIWLALGTSLLYVLMRRMSIPKWLALGLGLFVIATPSVYWANTFISTDAPTLATASLLGILAIRAYRTGKGFVLLPIVAAVTVLFKIQNLIAVGFVGVALLAALLVEKWPGRGSTGRWLGSTVRDRRFWVAALTVLFGILAQAVWLYVRSATTPPGQTAVKVDSVRLPLTVSSFVNESLRFISTQGTTGMSPGNVATVAGAVVSLVSVAAVLGIVIDGRRRPVPQRIIGWCTLAFALAMGPALVLATSSAVGFYFPLPVRYGLILLPAFLLCVAFWLDRFPRRGPAVVAVLGAVFAAAAIVL